MKPTHGLTDEEIEQMLLDSIENAETDVQNRLLVEQQVEAKRVLIDARKQLERNGDCSLTPSAPRSRPRSTSSRSWPRR